MTTIPIEALPVAVGAMIGLAAWRLAPHRLAPAVVAVLAVPAGFAITALAGELELSGAFVVFDVGQVVLAALLTLLAAQARARRPAVDGGGQRRRGRGAGRAPRG
jgi:hypothetical protein